MKCNDYSGAITMTTHTTKFDSRLAAESYARMMLCKVVGGHSVFQEYSADGLPTGKFVVLNIVEPELISEV